MLVDWVSDVVLCTVYYHYRYYIYITLNHSIVTLLSNHTVNSNLMVFSTTIVYINPLMATLKPQNNGPLYSNTLIGWYTGR